MHLYELLACFALISSVLVCCFASFPKGSWYPSRIWIWIGRFPGIWTGTLGEAPEWASYLSTVDGALNPVPLCDLDQPMLKEVMAENCGPVSYIPNQYIFHQESAHQMPGLSNIVGIVCLGKNIAKCSKNPQFLPVMRALF